MLPYKKVLIFFQTKNNDYYPCIYHSLQNGGFMSKKRREELENPSIRFNYLKHLEQNGMISQSEDFLLSDSSVLQYGIPWL